MHYPTLAVAYDIADDQRRSAMRRFLAEHTTQSACRTPFTHFEQLNRRTPLVNALPATGLPVAPFTGPMLSSISALIAAATTVTVTLVVLQFDGFRTSQIV